ncbi:hypothetical protein DVDV_1808 [Desulfovibrio sp. DV]|nr:hypothetical protein DVDV_1808 [Desulfovibrio sp. DV]
MGKTPCIALAGQAGDWVCAKKMGQAMSKIADHIRTIFLLPYRLQPGPESIFCR